MLLHVLRALLLLVVRAWLQVLRGWRAEGTAQLPETISILPVRFPRRKRPPARLSFRVTTIPEAARATPPSEMLPENRPVFGSTESELAPRELPAMGLTMIVPSVPTL